MTASCHTRLVHSTHTHTRTHTHTHTNTHTHTRTHINTVASRQTTREGIRPASSRGQEAIQRRTDNNLSHAQVSVSSLAGMICSPILPVYSHWILTVILDFEWILPTVGSAPWLRLIRMGGWVDGRVGVWVGG